MISFNTAVYVEKITDLCEFEPIRDAKRKANKLSFVLFLTLNYNCCGVFIETFLCAYSECADKQHIIEDCFGVKIENQIDLNI